MMQVECTSEKLYFVLVGVEMSTKSSGEVSRERDRQTGEGRKVNWKCERSCITLQQGQRMLMSKGINYSTVH